LVEKLIDNYNQARGCMSRMETRLVKKGRIAEFNRQFQDNVDRGVFRPISREVAAQYKGAVNYISMVEAFKTGLFATTPLRICMNSSMRQPALGWTSFSYLGDCLMSVLIVGYLTVLVQSILIINPYTCTSVGKILIRSNVLTI
jgi:hypothetical protein